MPPGERAPGQHQTAEATLMGFDPAYVEHVIPPFLHESFYWGRDQTIH